MSHSWLYAAVLVAAITHAWWNAIVKNSSDRLLTLASIRVVGLAAGLAVALFVPFPSPESIPYLIAAIAFHYLYYALMLNAYRVGDMSQVYPISRGSAPLLVALLAASFAGERLTLLSALAVFVVSAGILSLARAGRAFNREAVLFALLTGVAIAGYSFLSGLGVRKAGTLLGYNAWLEIGAGVGMIAIAFARRRATLTSYARARWREGVVAGLLSVGGYAIALWAMYELPMAPVVALRESSVVFGVVAGSLLLREEFGGPRLAAASVVLVGIVLLGIGATST